MNKQKRHVFLYGAGAVIPWGGPTTSELTKIVRECGYKIRNGNTRITEYIYSRLLDSGYSDDEVNFETIISVLDELTVYYSEQNSKTQTPSLLRAFIKENEESPILNYSISNGLRKHGYSLEIPENTKCYDARNSYHGENPNQFFLSHILATVLTAVAVRISHYSYHTKNYSAIDHKSECSRLFTKWIKSKHDNGIIRLYTLNYDRVFKNILLDCNIDCFEGFEIPENHTGELLRANISRILNDSDSPVHYNLHGSTYWKVLATDKASLPNPEIVFWGGPGLAVNDDIAYSQMEKGKPFFVNSIITGFQKAQRSAVSPCKQMQASFDRDCCNADKIFIVGYAFGDEHINESIKIALRHNPELSLEIVDPNFLKGKMDEMLYLKFFPYLKEPLHVGERIRENEYSYFHGKVKVFNLGFTEYLKRATMTKLEEYNFLRQQ